MLVDYKLYYVGNVGVFAAAGLSTLSMAFYFPTLLYTGVGPNLNISRVLTTYNDIGYTSVSPRTKLKLGPFDDVLSAN